jgi:hypothetical protein
MFERDDPQDLKKELARQAAQKTAQYIRDKMRTVQSFEDIYAVHDFALANATLTQGLFLEFGVYSGKTIRVKTQ